MNIKLSASQSRYQFVKVLASGGSAKVYLLERLVPGYGPQKIVFKVPHFGAQCESESRLEAQRLQALRHKNIVSVLGAESMADGTSGLLLEYIEGFTLSEIIQTRAFKRRELLAQQVLSQAASALQFAHKFGFTHGDLSSRNIMISKTGETKLLDFGLSGTKGYRCEKGTVEYSSPERLLGQKSDGSCDWFALAVIVAELLLGHHPYQMHLDRAAVERARYFRKTIKEMCPSPWGDWLSKMANAQGGDEIDFSGDVAECGERDLDCLKSELQSLRLRAVERTTNETVDLKLIKKAHRFKWLAALIALVVAAGPKAVSKSETWAGRLRPCVLTMTSRPWGEVFLNGKSIGYTPILNHPVKAGAHQVRWVGPQGQVVEKTLIAFNNGIVMFRLDASQKSGKIPLDHGVN
ncbi:MAG: serine/threonine protein kinase [Oligoflexia bacterium]|nr:serine/threonine protein kinase [Oligoflexia bacterium]